MQDYLFEEVGSFSGSMLFKDKWFLNYRVVIRWYNGLNSNRKKWHIWMPTFI